VPHKTAWMILLIYKSNFCKKAPIRGRICIQV
jgi:hypothetical protein